MKMERRTRQKTNRAECWTGEGEEMTAKEGRELVRAALRCQETPRAPWVPFAGVHAGRLRGYAAEEMLRDGEKLSRSLEEVHRRYRPDGMPVVFDLQLEAEILGCELLWSGGSPPSVKGHPLAGTREIPAYSVDGEQGRLPLVFSATRRLRALVGDSVAIYGLFCGPLTLASHLRGPRIFSDMKKDPGYLVALVEACAGVARTMADLWGEAGADVAVPVDPLVSQISPEHFGAFCRDPYQVLFERIRDRGMLSSFFVCGNAAKNIEGMCRTGPDGISVDENLDMAETKKITDAHGVSLGGNIPLTTVMMFGAPKENVRFVLDMVSSLSPRGLIVSPGCDMPYDLPPENVEACALAVRDPEAARALLAEGEEARGSGLGPVSPDAGESGETQYRERIRPTVELYTLDPESCAACTYMRDVWQEARETLGEVAFWEAYQYNRREDAKRIRGRGISHLPSLYVDGELWYDSLIPPVEELTGRIREAAARRGPGGPPEEKR